MKKPFEIWRHVKTGGLYMVLVRDAIIEADMTEAVVYRGIDLKTWVRPAVEFFDGRFVRED